jgi:hypothetical protein
LGLSPESTITTTTASTDELNLADNTAPSAFFHQHPANTMPHNPPQQFDDPSFFTQPSEQQQQASDISQQQQYLPHFDDMAMATAMDWTMLSAMPELADPNMSSLWMTPPTNLE